MKKFTTFSEWLKLREDGTSTACVAAYPRPIFSEPVRRTWPTEGNRKKKKKLDPSR